MATLLLSALLALRASASASNCTIDTFQTWFDANGTTADVVYAEYYPLNSTLVNPNSSISANPTELPATCAIQVNVTTEADTHISFGKFLPDSWNERFYHAAQEGDGIDWADMAVGLRYGFTSVGSDLGHGSDFEGTWYDNPESVIDFSWRANHITTHLGKFLTENSMGRNLDIATSRVVQRWAPYGSEAMWNESGSVGNGSIANQEVQYWYPRELLHMPNFTADDLDYNTVAYAESIDNVSADDYNPSQIAKLGGKLIQYHGYSDATVHPGIGLYYRDRLLETMAPLGVNVDDFYRLFIISGMEHCGNTPSNMEALWYIAGPTQATGLSTSLYSVPGYSNPKHDILLALVDWVENGVAPGYIIGSNFNSTVDFTADTIYRQRPICAYPKQAKYQGQGGIFEPENFQCELLY